MKRSAICAAVVAALGVSAVFAESSSEPRLLVIGPVESVDALKGTAVVLGQKIVSPGVAALAVGETAEVFGISRQDGSIVATAIRDAGPYTAGASGIFLSGTVERSDPSVGRVVLNGVSVDLTGAMTSQTMSPLVGSKLTVRGTQPVGHGIVVTEGIAGTGTSGIAGTGTSGIAGTGTSGIAGTGTAARGIAGTGTSGIAGTGTSGIAGTGTAARGIAGTGTSGIAGTGTSGIAGTGTSGIAGTGTSGIAGTGTAARGIAGTGTSGIAGTGTALGE